MISPLTFQPLPQQRIWGGRQLETQFHRRLPDPSAPYGESWDLVDRPDAQSVVTGGMPSLVGLTLNDLWTHHRKEVFGSSLESHPSQRFPLLMKILDAREDLSIQVHPPEALAHQLNGEPKTEMWFIAHAEPGAKIYAGLRPGVTREQFIASTKDGTVADLVHVLHPRSGDCLFIPSGRIHAIGAGLLIYEIQQNSDTTYRVFDWNRLGLDGKPRELHVEQSLASIDFTDFAPTFQTPTSNGLLIDCPFFEIRLCNAVSTSHIGSASTMEGLTVAVTMGCLQVGDATTLNAGDFAIIPPGTDPALGSQTSPEAQWLEIRIPHS